MAQKITKKRKEKLSFLKERYNRIERMNLSEKEYNGCNICWKVIDKGTIIVTNKRLSWDNRVMSSHNHFDCFLKAKVKREMNLREELRETAKIVRRMEKYYNKNKHLFAVEKL